MIGHPSFHADRYSFPRFMLIAVFKDEAGADHRRFFGTGLCGGPCAAIKLSATVASWLKDSGTCRLAGCLCGVYRSFLGVVLLVRWEKAGGGGHRSGHDGWVNKLGGVLLLLRSIPSCSVSCFLRRAGKKYRRTPFLPR